MKKILTLVAAMAMTTITFAQTALPYEADWKYKAESISTEDGTIIGDANAGKPSADQSLYDLGGWTLSGKQPFYIGVSKSKPIANTVEFVDGKQEKDLVSYLISPALDFSKSTKKTITFKCGKEADDQQSSNLSVLYSTDYTGDAETATWTSLKEDILPVTGMTAAKMGVITADIEMSEPSVVIAIKASKAKEGAFSAGAKQAKIRVTAFAVTEEGGNNISNNEAAQASAFVANGELNIVNADEVAKVEVFNVAGQNTLTQVRPANTISLNALSNGVYLVRLTTIDGNVATSKVAIK